MDMGGAEIMTAGEAQLTPAEKSSGGSQPNPDSFLKGKSTAGINEGLVSALKKAARDLGRPITVTSGVRSPEEQQKLYDNYMSGKSKFPAAPPGKSKHGSGNAVDIDSSDANALASAGLLAKYGLGQTVANDPVHIQQVSAASGAVLSGPSGGYSPGLTMHGTEAIVPIDTPTSSAINLGGGNTEMMTMQLARLEELASIFKSQLSVDQKLLQYSS
jgi:hypothetical protein